MPPFKVYTYHGIGDHLVCYGIIKEFAKTHDKVECYSDPMPISYFNTCKRLFSSLPNVELIFEPYVKEVINADHCIANTAYWLDQVKPWIENTYMPTPEWFNEWWIFDRQWYYNANLPLDLKWDNFYFERDLDKEKETFYDIFGLKDDEEFTF